MVKITFEIDGKKTNIVIPDPTTEQELTYWCTMIGNSAAYLIEETLRVKKLK